VSVVIVQPERYGFPLVPSRRVICQRCGASCWLSNRAELGADDGVMCVVCAMAVVKPGDTIDAGPWVVVDLAEILEEEGGT
jgi:hypothetical protein